MTIRHSPRLLWLLTVCAVATLVFLIRLHGTTDLESYGQPNRIGYLLDLMTQGHFFVQHDLNNVAMSVPPLHTWIMAPFAAVFGLNRVAVVLPSFLAVLAISVWVFEIGRRRLGELSAGLAAIAFLLSPATAKHIALVSPDPVFACIVATAILVCSTAWPESGGERKRWLLFSLTSALATLTMGAQGLLLSAGGLLACVWNDRLDSQRGTVSGPYFAALALFFGVVLAWLIPAGLTEGFGQATTMLVPAASGWSAGELLSPIVALLMRYLPFSLFLLVALVRQLRHSTADADERSFERFLATWLLGGLLVVSLTGQKGADPVFVLWPAGALLAGREMARLAERMGKTKFAGVAVVISCILIGATYNAVHSVGPGNLGTSVLGRELQLARNAELAASAMQAHGIDPNTLHHWGTPATLQFYLGTFHPLIDKAALDELLANATGPLGLATDGAGIESLGVADRFPGTRRIFRWPEDESQAPAIQVFRIVRQEAAGGRLASSH